MNIFYYGDQNSERWTKMFERLREKDLKDDPDHRKVCPTGWNDNEKPYHYRIDATKEELQELMENYYEKEDPLSEDGHSVVGNPYPAPDSPDTITFGAASANTTHLGGSDYNDTLSLGRISEFGGDTVLSTSDTIRLSDDAYPSLGSYLPPYYNMGGSFANDTLNFSPTPKPNLDKPGLFKYNEDVALKDARDYVTSTYSGHYTTKGSHTQTLDLIQSVGDAESFCRSNAIKYLSRYDKKGVPKNDILKAIHYCLLLYYFDGHTTETDSTNYPF